MLGQWAAEKDAILARNNNIQHLQYDNVSLALEQVLDKA